MRAAALLVSALILAGCGEKAQKPVDAPAGGITAAPSPTAAVLVAALDLDGLRLVDPASGKTRPLAFGLPRSTVEQAVAKATGITPKPSSLGECPAGPLDFAQFGPLTLNYLDGTFAGWSLRAGELDFSTMDGIGIGSTRSEVESSRTIEAVKDSTLGYEFFVGPSSAETTMSMIFDGADREAKIENLWAGVACNFR